MVLQGLRLKIALDDGHGINTPGKQSPDGYKENRFNHAVKLALAKFLVERGFEVIDCSPGVDDNSLEDRVRRSLGADIFISIHFNAMGDTWQDRAGGIETYFYEAGHQLAIAIHNQLIKGTKLKDRGIKKAGFYVIKYTKCPAILVECGFMDNKYEAILMKLPAYIKECAEEIFTGICDYFGVPVKVIDTDEKWVKIIKEVSNYSDKWISVFNELIKRKYPIDELIIKIYEYGKENK